MSFLQKVSAKAGDLKIRLKQDSGNVGFLKVPGQKKALPWREALPLLKAWSQKKLEPIAKNCQKRFGSKAKIKWYWGQEDDYGYPYKPWTDLTRLPECGVEYVSWVLEVKVTVTDREDGNQDVAIGRFMVEEIRESASGVEYHVETLVGVDGGNNRETETAKGAIREFILAIDFEGFDLPKRLKG